MISLIGTVSPIKDIIDDQLGEWIYQPSVKFEDVLGLIVAERTKSKSKMTLYINKMIRSISLGYQYMIDKAPKQKSYEILMHYYYMLVAISKEGFQGIEIQNLTAWKQSVSELRKLHKSTQIHFRP